MCYSPTELKQLNCQLGAKNKCPIKKTKRGLLYLISWNPNKCVCVCKERENTNCSCWCERGTHHLDHSLEVRQKPKTGLMKPGHKTTVVTSYKRWSLLGIQFERGAWSGLWRLKACVLLKCVFVQEFKGCVLWWQHVFIVFNTCEGYLHHWPGSRPIL